MRYEDLLPPAYRDLRGVRLLLPWSQLETPRTWGSLLPEGRVLRGDEDWHELALAQLTSDQLSQAAAPSGLLPTKLAARLRAIMVRVPATRLRSWAWAGYSYSGCDSGAEVDSAVGALCVSDPARAFRSGEYPAALTCDSEGGFAIAALPYPDSLFIAAEPVLFRELHQDRSLELVTVNPRDIVPPSAND